MLLWKSVNLAKQSLYISWYIYDQTEVRSFLKLWSGIQYFTEGDQFGSMYEQCTLTQIVRVLEQKKMMLISTMHYQRWLTSSKLGNNHNINTNIVLTNKINLRMGY